MNRIEAFARFLWDFVVGDDWRVALGVAVALAATAVIAGAGASAWWVMPMAVAALLTLSVLSVARRR
jgi:hypothetical protein